VNYITRGGGMTAKKLAELIKGKVLSGENLLDNIKITRAFAADLMSDVLAYVAGEKKDTILITGITNLQIVRTSEMLDIPVIIVARGKRVPEETIKLAKEKNIILIWTRLIVFIVSGILYRNGIKGAKINPHVRKTSSN
jgi:predicted transcriptional regulator